MSPADINRALDALMAIPSDLPYPDWFKVVCAAKASGLSIDVVDAWSSTASNYKDRHDVEVTFRNAKPDRGIGRGTLLYLEKQYGYQAAGKSVLKTLVSRADGRTSADPRPPQPTTKILADIAAACEPATASHPLHPEKLRVA